MERIARFEKVSEERFAADWVKTVGGTEEEARRLYPSLRLPRRATAGSAGYDFLAPRRFTLEPGEILCLPTGIRAHIAPGWVLQLFPRSGLGFKYRLQLNNTVGIIDSDYYFSDNEGHIFAKLINDSREGKRLTVEAGEGFMQGVFTPFGLTEDDDAGAIRNGGFGSTTGKGAGRAGL